MNWWDRFRLRRMAAEAATEACERQLEGVRVVAKQRWATVRHRLRANERQMHDQALQIQNLAGKLANLEQRLRPPVSSGNNEQN